MYEKNTAGHWYVLFGEKFGDNFIFEGKYTNYARDLMEEITLQNIEMADYLAEVCNVYNFKPHLTKVVSIAN